MLWLIALNKKKKAAQNQQNRNVSNWENKDSKSLSIFCVNFAAQWI